jgi:outer membrane receptor protein involved in Fe transport
MYKQQHIQLRRSGSRHSPSLLAFVGLMAPTALWATDTEPADTQQGTQLQAVTVTATTSKPDVDRTRVSADSSALPAAVTTVTSEDIGNTNVGRDISSIFRRVPGVLANNIDQGDTGNGFRMRGFATQGTHGADTAVSVDGVPQNIPSSQGGAGHGPVFLEWLTPGMIGSVDVIKGPVSALWGDQNRAGAVRIRTTDGGAAAQSSISATAESYGLRQAGLTLSSNFGGIDSLFVADLFRNDGYRYASHTDRNNAFWKLSSRQGDSVYSARVSYYRSTFDAAGYLLLPALEAGLDPRSTQANNPGFGDARRSTLVLNRRPADGDAGWHATLYAEDFERTRGITTSPTQHTVGHDDRTMMGGRVANRVEFEDWAALDVGFDARRDRGDAWRRIEVQRVPNGNFVNDQGLDLWTYGIFAQGQYKPIESVKLLAGLRYDRFDYDIDNIKLPAASTRYRNGVATPKVGLAWAATRRFEVFTNWAQGFRSPATEQISSSGVTGPLGAQGGVVSDVSPSKVTSVDLGFTSTPLDRWTFGGSVYHVKNDDEIVSQADGSYRSAGQTTRRGFELEARAELARRVSVYASYAHIGEASVDNPAPNTGAKLSVPKRQVKGGVQYITSVFDAGLTLNADAYLIDGIPYYVGTPQTTERTMPLYTRFDLRGTVDLRSAQVTLSAVFQPQRFGSEIAYGSAPGLLLSPVPREQYGISVRYFF